MDRPTLNGLRNELRATADRQVAEQLQRFFKTGAGEYGEGDRFLGVRVPRLRRLARAYRRLSLDACTELLRSPWHEERLLALLIFVAKYRNGGAEIRTTIHERYLEHTRYVNNWDLVDASAEHLVGAHITPTDTDLLSRLARSPSVWERRIAIMSTFHWIKRNEFAPTLAVAELLLADAHDLIHKAVGWMMREIGKRDLPAEEAFLANRYRRMPRTMLRYAVERFPEERRQQYLRGEVADE